MYVCGGGEQNAEKQECESVPREFAAERASGGREACLNHFPYHENMMALA